MPRLFTGIKIGADIAAQLARLKGGLHGARWIEPEDFHITLRFLGDVSEIEADDFVQKLEDIEAPAFSLRLEGMGAFGKSKPRLIYAAVAPSPALHHLHLAHERAAILAGLEPEGRKFTPHVTVARLRHSRAEDIARYLSEFGDFQTLEFEVLEFMLYSARQSRGGGPYVVEERFALA